MRGLVIQIAERILHPAYVIETMRDSTFNL